MSAWLVHLEKAFKTCIKLNRENETVGRGMNENATRAEGEFYCNLVSNQMVCEGNGALIANNLYNHFS